jgi:hypothetical protein
MRIEKLIDNHLKGPDLVLCWFVRRIQPLQHHDRLLHEYSKEQSNNLWVTKDNLPSDALDYRLKKMMKLHDKKHDWDFCLDMYTKGSCPKVRFLPSRPL